MTDANVNAIVAGKLRLKKNGRPLADNVEAARGTRSKLKLLELSAEDIVLDIGANVCSVANYAASFGARVDAYEPLPPAVAAARPADGVTLHAMAVTADGRDISMKIKREALDRDYFCSASVAKRAARRDEMEFNGIPSVAIAKVMEALRPTVVKIDTEGSEYELIPALDLTGVRAVFIEFHGLESPARLGLVLLCVGRILRQGFGVAVGWPKNIAIAKKDGRHKLVHAGFWKELLFVRGAAPPPRFSELMEQLTTLKANGEYTPHNAAERAMFEEVAK